MGGATLLERIAAMRAQGPQASASQGSAFASIVSNLRMIFNARQGSSQARPDYGMPDFGDLMYGFNQLLPDIARAIKVQIELFEPRLSNVQVRPHEDADSIGSVRFAIRASIVGEESGLVTLDGALSGDGRLEVQG